VLVIVPMGTVARLDKTAGVTTPNGRSRRHLFSFGPVAENTGPDIVNLRRCAADVRLPPPDFAALIRLIRAISRCRQGAVTPSPGTDMISYIPVLTTLFSVFFLSRIVPHYLAKRSPYLLWWTLGVLTFGLGTLTESINAIFGWTEWNTKIWYIVGALLGGYPLAQGTIYLLMKKRFADISALVCSTVILVAAVCVLSSPVEIPEGFDYRLTGKVFTWQWVRGFSPLLNLYAFVFLFGGAVYSAVQYFAKEKGRARFLGNILIAIGALLPGIGGSFTRFGYVEVLYITELIGLIFIYFGYDLMRKDRSATLHANQRMWEGSLPVDPHAT
jgi:hypothetical protein